MLVYVHPVEQESGVCDLLLNSSMKIKNEIIIKKNPTSKHIMK